MSRNKLYIPLDECFNMFSISSSTTGLVVPLAPFGYSRIHLTIYIKNMEMKDGFQKLSVHLTNELTGDIIKEFWFEFAVDLVEQHLSKMFENFVHDYLDILTMHLVEEDTLSNKKLYCYDCFINSQLDYNQLNKKTRAQKQYFKIIETLEAISPTDCNICSDSNHRQLIDIKTNAIYFKSSRGILKLTDNDKMATDLISLIETTFTDKIKSIDEIIEDFKEVLEEYKVDL